MLQQGGNQVVDYIRVFADNHPILRFGCESAPNRDPAPARVTTLIRRREPDEPEGSYRRRQGPHHEADY
jgi:hypothetical protein